MRKLPQDDSVELAVHDRGVVRVTIEVGPARQSAIESFYQVYRILAVTAGQLLRQPRSEVTELVPGYRCHRPHRAPWPPFANDPMSEEREPVVDVCHMGFVHVQRQLEFAFQERSTFFADGLCLRLGSLDDDEKVIGVTAIGNRRFPLPILTDGNGPLLLDAVVPSPAILVRFLAQVLRLQPLIELVEHDIGQKWRDDAPNVKGNFRFEREIVQWRDRPLIDLRRKR